MKRSLPLILFMLMLSVLVIAQDTQPNSSGKPAEAQSPERAPTVDQILDKYAQALGGKDAIQQVSRRVMKGTFTSPDLQTDGTFEMYAKAPNKQLTVLRATGFGTFRQ